jgi:hypothetical protein
MERIMSPSHAPRIILLALLLPACDQDTSTGLPDSGTDAALDVLSEPDAAADPVPETTPDAAPDSPPEPGEPSFGSDSAFDDVHDMADWVNSQREGYEPHDRYWGIPFSDDHFHSNVTWPIVMTWDDTAAAIAQNAADDIARGSMPPELLSVEGGIIHITTPLSRPHMVHTSEGTMSSVNPFMRMAAYYHDFGGEGPVLTTIGIGASDMGDGSTAWVLVFN